MGKGSSAQERYLSASMDPLVKVRDMKYRRNVCTVTRLKGVSIATTAYCHREALGNVLGTVFDNVQEPKLSVNTGRGRRRGVCEYPDTAASAFSVDSGLLFSNALLEATEI